MIEVNLGIIQNLFICVLFSIGSIFFISSLFKKGKGTLYEKLFSTFGIYWTSVLLVGFFAVLNNYFAWNNSVEALNLSVRLTIIIFVIQAFLLCYFFAENFIFKNIAKITTLAVVGILYLFYGVMLLGQPTFIKQVNYWNITTTNGLSAFHLILIIPFIALFLYSLYSYSRFSNQLQNNQKHIYIYMFILNVLFQILLYVDFFQIMSGWRFVMNRIFLLIVMLLFQANLFEQNEFTISKDIKLQYSIKSSLMKKSIYFLISTILFPLIIAGLLLYISFFSFTRGIINNDLLLAYTKQQIIIMMLVFGLVAFYITLLTIRSLVKRINMLLVGMINIMNNQFNYIPATHHRIDEIGLVTESFNQLVYSLNSSYQQVSSYNKELEDKVEQRNSELEIILQKEKDLQERLQEMSKNTENQADIVIDSIGDGMMLLSENLHISQVNKQFCTIFNLTKDELIGKSIEDVNLYSIYLDLFQTVQAIVNKKSEETQDVKILLQPPLIGMYECSITGFHNTSTNHFNVLLFFRKYNPPWGTVFNAQTMRPINDVIIRLYNESNEKIIETARSDVYGRFSFYVDPGTYYIKAFKDGFHFPAKNPLGYHGEAIAVKNKAEGIIRFNILMDQADSQLSNQNTNNHSTLVNTLEKMVKEDDGQSANGMQLQQDINKLLEEYGDDNDLQIALEQRMQGRD